MTDPAEPAWTFARRPLGRGDAIALLAWTAAIVAFFWDAVSFRGAFFYFDISEINLPYRHFFAEELKAGRFSRWCPDLYCGLPLFSESQAGYLHPLKYLLYPWLPTWQAFNLDTVLSVWLTGLGTYGWLRRHVGPAGALTGAAVLGLGGFTWAHLIHTSMTNALASVPFALWALETAWAGGRLRGVALGAVALACQVFAGHLQDTLFTAGLIGAYGLYRATTERGRGRRAFAIGAAVGLVGLGVMLAAVQWIPSKELLDRSPRAGGLTWEDLTYGSWSPELLPSLVVREAFGTRARDTDWMDGFYPYHEMNAYLGVTALALAVLGARGAARDRWGAFWIVLAGLGGILMLGRFTCLFDRMHQIPIVGSSRIPVRFHLWVTVAVAALAAMGVDRLARAEFGRVRLRAGVGLVLGMAAVSALMLAAVYAPSWSNPNRFAQPSQQLRNGWLGRELAVGSARTGLLALLAYAAAVRAAREVDPARRGRFAAALPAIVILDLLGAHWPDAPTVDPRYWTDPPETVLKLRADPTFVRTFGIAADTAGTPGYASKPIDLLAVRDPLGWSLPAAFGLASAIGETPMHSRRLTEYFDRSAVTGGRYDIEGVTHWTTGRRQDGLPYTPERSGSALIYRNPNALPRARVMGRPAFAADDRAALDRFSELGAEARTRPIIEDPGRPPTGDARGSARIAVDLPERVEVDVEVDPGGGPGYLILADTFDPGWSAQVDGRPTPIFPAYLAFRAVRLEPGRHRVVFTYRPAGVVAGLAATAVGIVLAIAAIAVPRRWTTPGPDHGPLEWRRGWTWGYLAILVIIVAGSAVRVERGGSVRLHPRWAGSVHQFTWGAGIGVMRPPPRR